MELYLACPACGNQRHGVGRDFVMLNILYDPYACSNQRCACGAVLWSERERDECLFGDVPGQLYRMASLHPTAAVLRAVLQAAGLQTDRASGMGIGWSQGCHLRRTTQTQRNSGYKTPNGIRTHDPNERPVANRCCHRLVCLGIILFDKCRL